MQFSSVVCLVSALQLVRSVRIELRYNKPECGPYGFRCLNDRMFEICAEFKRADDYYFTGEDKLYPPIGSKALCPEGRECDKDNPLYCTSEREERYTQYQRKHKKCNDQTTPPPPTSASEDDDDDAEDDDDSAQAQCHTEPPCKKAPEIVFDESKTQGAHSAAAHAHAPCPNTTSQAQAAEAPTYQIHSQGGKPPCGKHAHINSFSEVLEDSGSQGAHDSKEVPCSSCDNAQPEESPPVVFYETGQGAQNGSCDQTCDDSCSQDTCSEDTCSDTTSTDAPETPCSSCSYRCIRAGNYPDPKDCKKYFFCDINIKGDGFVASHKSCRGGEVFNSALRECIPIENLHADTKRSSDYSGFKCEKCGDFPDPDDCHKYYHCEKTHGHGNCGKKFETSHLCCPEGTKFIRQLKRCGCVSPDECEDKKREIGNEEKSSAAEPHNNDVALVPTPETAAYGPSDYELENLHADTKRSSDYSGFNCVKCGDFPDPDDCHKYYHCEKAHSHSNCGKKFEMSHLCCPEGTKFIRQLKRCGCISPDECEDKKREIGKEEKREIGKEEKRCAEVPCASPPNKCIVVMSTPEPSSCGSCDDEYEEGPELPDGEPDQDDDGCGDQCDDQCGDQCGQCGGQGNQCGGQCGSAQPVVRCPSHPAINLPKMHHFNCHGEGKFADPYNCTTFFVCHPKRAQGGFEKFVMSCPSGEVFDQTLQKCVPSHG